MPILSRRLRGFTLTELAIVLGIIGLILGAIWTAASKVYDNMKIKKANEQLVAISQAVKALYAGKHDMGGASGDITLSLMNFGVFPSDMIVGGQPVSPFGTNVEIYGSWPDSSHFIVEFDGQDRGRSSLKGKYCLPLLIQNYKNTATDVTNDIEVTNGGWMANTITAPASTFSGCTTASFVYSINK